MIVLKVKGAVSKEPLAVGAISGAREFVEGEAAEFRLPVCIADSSENSEVRIESQAFYQSKDDTPSLPTQTQYVDSTERNIVWRFIPDAVDASDDERKSGIMTRTLTISVTYRISGRLIRETRTIPFTLKLNSEKIVRRVSPALGKLLSLTPKNMK
jgi:hypothetical protein